MLPHSLTLLRKFSYRYSVFPAAVGEAGEGREAGHDVVETLRAEEAGEAHLGVAVVGKKFNCVIIA